MNERFRCFLSGRIVCKNIRTQFDRMKHSLVDRARLSSPQLAYSVAEGPRGHKLIVKPLAFNKGRNVHVHACLPVYVYIYIYM